MSANTLLRARLAALCAADSLRLLDERSTGADSADDGLVCASARSAAHPVVIVAQDSTRTNGTLGLVHCARLAGAVRAAADLPGTELVVCFDSAGVRLDDAAAGITGLALVLRELLDLRLAGTVVSAIIDGPIGCFGGSFLLACAASRVCANTQARIGLSGPRALAALTDATLASRAQLAAYYTAAHRYATGEVQALAAPARMAAALAGVTPERVGRALLDALVQRHAKALRAVDAVEARPALPATGPAPLMSAILAVGRAWRELAPGVVAGEYGDSICIGATGAHPFGPHAALACAAELLLAQRQGRRRILLLGDVFQSFASRNEACGYAGLLATLALVVRALRADGVRVVTLLAAGGSAAALVAFGLMADEVLAAPDARLEALPDPAVRAILGAGTDGDAGAPAGVYAGLGLVEIVTSLEALDHRLAAPVHRGRCARFETIAQVVCGQLRAALDAPATLPR